MSTLIRFVLSVTFGLVVYVYLTDGIEGVKTLPDDVVEYISTTEFGKGFKQGFEAETRKFNGN